MNQHFWRLEMRGPTRPGGEAGPLGPAQCPPRGTRRRCAPATCRQTRLQPRLGARGSAGPLPARPPHAPAPRASACQCDRLGSASVPRSPPEGARHSAVRARATPGLAPPTGWGWWQEQSVRGAPHSDACPVQPSPLPAHVPSPRPGVSASQRGLRRLSLGGVPSEPSGGVSGRS